MIPTKASPPCEVLPVPVKPLRHQIPMLRLGYFGVNKMEFTFWFPSLLSPSCPPFLAMQEKRERAKLEARLRRVCEKKLSGKLQVPDDVHQACDNLIGIFVNSGCDKVTCFARNSVSCWTVLLALHFLLV